MATFNTELRNNLDNNTFGDWLHTADLLIWGWINPTTQSGEIITRSLDSLFNGLESWLDDCEREYDEFGDYDEVYVTDDERTLIKVVDFCNRIQSHIQENSIKCDHNFLHDFMAIDSDTIRYALDRI